MEAHYIFQPSTIWVRPLFTELGPKKTQKADFAMKQTNICRLSGDIISISPSSNSHGGSSSSSSIVVVVVVLQHYASSSITTVHNQTFYLFGDVVRNKTT